MIHTVVDSPVGPLTLVARDGALAAVWTGAHRPAEVGERVPDALPAARKQLEAYFAGRLRVFELPLAAVGTDFQRRVWAALAEIPYGQTRSYGELARALGSPGASRAVGLANGRNPLSIIVPCHRVIGSDGSLTGYGGGLACKRFLLDHESGAGALL